MQENIAIFFAPTARFTSRFYKYRLYLQKMASKCYSLRTFMCYTPTFSHSFNRKYQVGKTACEGVIFIKNVLLRLFYLVFVQFLTMDCIFSKFYCVLPLFCLAPPWPYHSKNPGAAAVSDTIFLNVDWSLLSQENFDVLQPQHRFYVHNASFTINCITYVYS